MTQAMAVYIHIPFCTVKCGYCDFNTYAALDPLKPAYAAALLREVQAWHAALPERTVTSISFGGGTPGEFPADALVAAVAAVREAWTLTPGAEISLEANPGTTTLPCLSRLVSGGFNRISFGAQSFNADELRFLDRIHSPEAIPASVALAREAGFASVGLDLIYGLPAQPLAAWCESLEAAVALRLDYLSCYALTVEEGTPLATRVDRCEVAPPDPDAAADMYELTCTALEGAGYEQYEISNWALDGHQSRHNRTYWSDADYLGLGAGAHGYLTIDGHRTRYENTAHPRAYIAAAAATGGDGLPTTAINRYEPAGASAMVDWLEGRLRLIEGFPTRDFTVRFGMPMEEALGPTLAWAEANSLLERSGETTRLTARGRLLHGELCAEALATLQR